MDGKLRAYFYFTRNERIGILSLCLLSFCLLFVPRFMQQSGFAATTDVSKKEQEDYNTTRSALVDRAEKLENRKLKMTGTANRFSGKIDVNTASFKQLTSLGLSTKTASIMIKYRDRGGQFQNSESLSKIYGITAQEISLLTKSALFPSKAEIATEVTLTPTAFDPNTVTVEELAEMGLPLRIVQTIQNFRSKGGRFYKTDDLSKIYGMKAEWFESLKPFVQIQLADSPRTRFESAKSSERRNFNTAEPFNINTATKEEIMKLKGIGNYYADKILKYRDALGGFVRLEQIAEIRGLPDSLYRVVAAMARVNSDYNKLKINQLDKESLARHPYISHPQALILSNYKLQHGHFKSMSDIRKSRAFSEAEMAKIEAYLDFSE